MIRYFNSFLLLILFQFELFAQAVLPFIENYSKQEYKGDNQIWGITQGNDNALYFANNYYLLRYNGVDFEKHTLPNKTIIRSVFAYKDLIFSGSFNEFGYWKRENGNLNYHSLVPYLFFTHSDSEEVWKIFEWNGKIYFQTFGEMYEYDFKKIIRIKFPNTVSYCFVIDEQFYAATLNDGIYKWDSNNFINITKWNALKGKIIHSIEKIAGKIYFFTQKNGVFVQNGTNIEEWNHPLNTLLKKQLINTSKLIDNQNLALGTSSNGLYLINFKVNTYENINKKSSLQNNSVLSIQLDKEKDLWLGLDNGITHIEYNSPYAYFTDTSGNLGSVYAISDYKNDALLLGSNHGLFVYEDNQLKFIENSQGQIWSIYKEGELYVIGHNDGTFLFENGVFSKKSAINGGWSFKPNKFGQGYIQSNYNGLAFYKTLDNVDSGVKLEGFNAPIKNFVQISEDEIIAAHNNKGLFYIKFDTKLFKLITIENISKTSGITDDYGVKIFEFKGEFLYYINKKWYYFDKISTKLKIHELFNENFKDISEIVPIDNTRFAVVKNDILFLIRPIATGYSWFSIFNKRYEGKLINNEVKIVKFNKDFVLNIDDGFVVFMNSTLTNAKQKIEIEGFIEGQLINKQKVPYGANVVINVISEFYGNKRNTVYYSLNQSIPTPLLNQKIILNNLSSGKYQISIYDNTGIEMMELANFSFSVKMPWFASFWMILLYMIFLIFLLYLYYRWNKVRFKEKFKLKEEELKHANKLRQMELEAKNLLKIQEYEKHILENQVQMKANELAGKSLSLAKQTELIESIQAIIETENNTQSLKSKIQKAVKINKLNKNEWKSFETNLLKSNEDFVKILTHKFPNLTSKDLKLCIYLKMNLATKEIAPLMNISYRGVELHRYRLRKKLNLGQEENLNPFMNNL